MLIGPVIVAICVTLGVAASPALEERMGTSHVTPPKQGGFEVVIIYAQPEDGCPAPKECTSADLFVSTASDVTTLLPPSAISSPLERPVSDKSSPAQTPPSASFQKPAPTNSSPVEKPAFSQSATTVKLPPSVHWTVDTSSPANIIPVPAHSGSPMYYGQSNPSQAGYFAFLTYNFTSPSVNLDHCDYTDVTCTQTGCKVSFRTSEAYEYAVKHWSTEIILVTYTEGCSLYADSERCYFKVTTIHIKDGLVIEVDGAFHSPDSLTSQGQTEWGWWTPGTEEPTSSSSENSGSSSTNSSRTCRSYPSCGRDNSTRSITYSRDDVTGTVRPGMNHYAVTSDPANDGTMRGWVSEDPRSIIGRAHTKSWQKDYSFKVPDASNAKGSKLRDQDIKKTVSPWGDSILLKSFGTQSDSGNHDGSDKKLGGYMNIFCVDCGVSGNVTLAGRATWTRHGLTEGYVDMRTDLRFAMKLGIDAQMSYQHEFNKYLYSYELPGIKYSIVSITPSLEVGSHITLDARAKGRLLAGAETGLRDAHVLVDFVNPSNSHKDGWDPYLEPVIEADGDIKLSASLGLPLAIKCSLKFFWIEKEAGVVDEPSLTATAQVAASIGSSGDGSFAAGFNDTDGCTGISTQVSWRNEMYAYVGDKKFPLLDTKDNPLARGCIKLPGLPSTSTDLTPTPTLVGTSSTSSNTAAPTSSSSSHVTVSSPGLSSTGASTTDHAGGVDAGTSAPDAEGIPVPSPPFDRTDGYKSNFLTVPDSSVVFTACHDANVDWSTKPDKHDIDDIYAVPRDQAQGPRCNLMWKINEGSVEIDARLHYDKKQMSNSGVSFLKVHHRKKVPEGSERVALKVHGPNGRFLAMSTGKDESLFYPLLCTYSSNRMTQMFIARDRIAGLEALQGAMPWGNAGEKIDKCFDVPLVREKSQKKR